MAKSAEVAVAGNTAVAVAMNFESDAQSGFEEMNQDDFALPFLRILTNMSPEIGEVDGASPGMLYNSVTGELFDGKKGVEVIPCSYVRQYIEWAPRGQGSGGPLNIYPATSDILSRTHREPGDNRDYLDNGSYIENTANHYVQVLDANGVASPALIVMKSTQLKMSRKWNSMMMSVKLQGKNGLFTPPMYSQVYRLTVVSQENSKGKWHGWNCERIGDVQDANAYTQAKSFAESISLGDVKAKHQDESKSGAAGGESHSHF